MTGATGAGKRPVTTRELTDAERKLLMFLLSDPFPGRDELLTQAETVRTRGASCGCGCPSFWLDPDTTLPPAQVLERVPVSASGRDPGGNLVGIILFVDDGYMSDVEVFSHEGTSIFEGVPDPAKLVILRWSEPDEHGGRYALNSPPDE